MRVHKIITTFCICEVREFKAVKPGADAKLKNKSSSYEQKSNWKTSAETEADADAEPKMKFDCAVRILQC